MRALLLGALLLTGARVGASEVESLEQWEQWLREPLLLNEAEAEELALLPWIDRGLAEGIVGLRREGGLSRLEDLQRVPGMDPERIAAILPFVRFEEPAAPPRVRIETVGTAREGRTASLRTRLEAERRSWRLLVQGNGDEQSEFHGAASWAGEHLRVLVGRFVVHGAWPLLTPDPGLRSRTGPPSLERVSRLRPRLSHTLPASTGGGLEWSPPGWRILAAYGVPDEPGVSRAQLEIERRWASSTSRRLAFAWRERGGSGLSFSFRNADTRGRIELAQPAARGTRSSAFERSLRGCAALEWRHAGSRLGLAFTESQAGAEGQDPLSSQSLDREHRSWQCHGSLRRGGWSLSGLARGLRRGHPGDAERRLRWQLEAAGPWNRSRLRLRLRMDELESETERWSVLVDWREHDPGGGWGRGMSLRRSLSRSSESLLWALQLERGRRWFLRASAAVARGSAASLWAVGLPTVGLSSAWLSPGEWGFLLSLGRRDPSRRGCLWMRLTAGAATSAEWVGGLGLRMAWGEGG